MWSWVLGSKESYFRGTIAASIEHVSKLDSLHCLHSLSLSLSTNDELALFKSHQHRAQGT